MGILAEKVWSDRMIEQGRDSLFPYPYGLLRWAMRAPLLAYRTGLGDWMNAIHLMVLTTRGRRSGKPRHAPIEYRRHGSKIYLISVWDERPHWYQNLLADPLATIQLGGQTVSALADPVTDPAEALRALQLFRRVAPSRYDAVLGRLIEEDVNARTLPDVSGQFTIMRLNLISDAPILPSVPRDLVWVWPALLALAALLLLATFVKRSTPPERPQ